MHLQRLLQQATDNSSEATRTPTGYTPMLRKSSEGNQSLHAGTKQPALELLLIVSNGKYKAVLHRTTVNKDETRISWPVFIEPQPEQEVGPHPKLVNQDNPPKYKTKKYKDYAYCKLNKIPQ